MRHPTAASLIALACIAATLITLGALLIAHATTHADARAGACGAFIGLCVAAYTALALRRY